MIIGRRVTLFHRTERSFRNTGFDIHYSLHFLFSGSLIKTSQLEHLYNMFFILITDIGSHIIIVQIIFSFTQTDTPLIQLKQIALAVHDIGTHIETEIREYTAMSQFRHQRNYFRFILH